MENYKLSDMPITHVKIADADTPESLADRGAEQMADTKCDQSGAATNQQHA